MQDNNNIDLGKSIEVVKYGKNVKASYGNVADLSIQDDLNIRFHAGSEILGIKITKDSRDLPGMWQDIVTAGRIIEPLWVSERTDGQRIVLRGNRRAGASQIGLQDTTISAELRHALTKETPLLVFKGLSLEQEQELVQDQTQKAFLRSEIVRHVFALRAMRWSYEQIVTANWERLAALFSTHKMVAQYRELTDPTLKVKKLKTWFHGSVEGYLVNGFDTGPWMQRQIMLSEMRLDGLLEKEAEQPYYFTNVNPQDRMLKMRKAMREDGSRFNGLMPLDVEDSAFAKQAKVFHDEDYPTNGVKVVTTPKGVLTKGKIEDLGKGLQSTAAKQVIAAILMQEAPELTNADDWSLCQETKRMLVEQRLARFSPEWGRIIRLCFLSPDVVDFKAWLDSVCTHAHTSEGENVPSADENGQYSLGDEGV